MNVHAQFVFCSEVHYSRYKQSCSLSQASNKITKTNKQTNPLHVNMNSLLTNQNHKSGSLQFYHAVLLGIENELIKYKKTSYLQSVNTLFIPRKSSVMAFYESRTISDHVLQRWVFFFSFIFPPNVVFNTKQSVKDVNRRDRGELFVLVTFLHHNQLSSTVGKVCFGYTLCCHG